MAEHTKVAPGTGAPALRAPHGTNGARTAAGHAPTARERRPALPPPYELTEFGEGSPKTVDNLTAAALRAAEDLLGYRLTLVQGSYNKGGVSASAGTHDGGGVVDLLEWDHDRKVRALRTVGFAAWWRPTLPGVWKGHIHAVLIGNDKLAPVAARQVTAYRNGRDGLKSNLVDDTWRPDPIPEFDYHAKPAADPVAAAKAAAAVPALGSAYPPQRTMDGVDTSHHQGGRIDVRLAQAQGLRWWYLKSTEGTGFVDPTYRKRMRQARAAGIPVGSYHFARPDGDDAAAEARAFLASSDIRSGDMLPMLDLEAMGDLSVAELTEWTGTWVKTVTRSLAAKGLAARPIIYTRFSLGNGFGCLLWVARYSNTFEPPAIPHPWKRAAIWQHSDGTFGPITNVPGFGHVDVSAMHPDVPLAALLVRPVSAPAPAKAAPRPAPPAAPAAAGSTTAQPTAAAGAASLDPALTARLEAAVQSIQAVVDTLKRS